MKKIIIVTVVTMLLFFTDTVLAMENDERLFTLVHNGNNNYFDFYVSPGEIACLEFQLFNTGNSEITNNLLIYDSETAVNGGNIIMSPVEFTIDKTACWFETNNEKITLYPDEKISKQIYFTVPENIVPGKYTAILALYSTNNDVIEQKETGEEEVGIKLNRYYTSTLAIVLRVGKNPEREICFSDGAHFVIEENSGRSFLYVPLRNSGYTYEFPQVNVEVFDSDNLFLFSDSLTMDIVYMDSETYACFDTTGNIIESGEFEIRAIMTDSKTKENLDDKVFKCDIKKNDVKKAIIKQAQNENTQKPGWGEGFFVFEKKHIYVAGGISATLLSLMLGFILYKKSK